MYCVFRGDGHPGERDIRGCLFGRGAVLGLVRTEKIEALVQEHLPPGRSRVLVHHGKSQAVHGEVGIDIVFGKQCSIFCRVKPLRHVVGEQPVYVVCIASEVTLVSIM